MGSTCLVGAAGFDVIAYARAMIEDTSALMVPDSSLLIMVKRAAGEFSRHQPLDEVVGNPATGSSSCNTVQNQQRYVCTPANGFAVAPIRITDVLYRAGGAYSASTELTYLTLLPFSPLNRFLFSSNLLDAPSERIIRNQYLDELQHYGKGFAGIVRDRTTGLLAVDLYPIPTASGVPVFFRYQARHAAGGTSSDPTYPTVPDDLAYVFGDLLYASCLDLEADRVSKIQKGQAGFLDIEASARDLRTLASDVRDRALAPLGAYQGVGITSF